MQTTRTGFVSAIQAALAERSAVIGARVARTHAATKRARRTIADIPSDATIILNFV